MPKEVTTPRPTFTGEQKSSVLAAEAVIGIDDKSFYENEQLSNLNRYYFLPYLNEDIPYKEGVRTVVEGKRERLKEFAREWDELTSGASSEATGDLREQVLQQQREQLPKYTEELSKIVQPMLTYVNAFCTNLFTSLTLDEIESAIVSG